MKKMIVAVVLATLALCTSVQAQNEDGINPLSVARSFSLKAPTHFECRAHGNIMASNSPQQAVLMEFVMDSHFAITNLSVNGVRIPLSEPLNGLPLATSGISDFWMNVTARTRSGEYAGNGYVNQNLVMPGDSLVVTLRPADVRIEIPVDVVTYGDDIDLIIDDTPFGYGYGVSDGHFYVYLPPVGGRYHYTLKQRSTGIPIGEGWLEPFKDVVTSSDMFFGVRYPGNVQGVLFQNPNGQDDWIGIGNMQYNCSVPVSDGGLPVAGKVIFADTGTGGLEVVVNDQCWIYVQQASSENGDMTFLPLVVRGNQEYQTRVATQPRAGKVVITIVPKNNTNQGVWVNFHRYYGVLPPISDGGGMGRPTDSDPALLGRGARFIQ